MPIYDKRNDMSLKYNWNTIPDYADKWVNVWIILNIL